MILLLANPGFNEESTEMDHNRCGFNDWGLWGLCSRTKPTINDWWRKRLNAFVKDINSEYEWRNLSWKVASIQAVPWASEEFHEMNGLPSKKIIEDLVKNLAVKNTL